jgi:hypothetical protein
MGANDANASDIARQIAGRPRPDYRSVNWIQPELETPLLLTSPEVVLENGSLVEAAVRMPTMAETQSKNHCATRRQPQIWQ